MPPAAPPVTPSPAAATSCGRSARGPGVGPFGFHAIRHLSAVSYLLQGRGARGRDPEDPAALARHHHQPLSRKSGFPAGGDPGVCGGIGLAAGRGYHSVPKRKGPLSRHSEDLRLSTGGSATSLTANPLIFFGSPNGNRTRVFAVRGQYPRPLDDGTVEKNVSKSSGSVNGVIEVRGI
jgi:hypothetical protein